MDKFSFFKSYYEAAKDLPADVYKESMNALFAYVFEGKEPEGLSPYANMFFTLVKPYADKTVKLSEGGAKGGASHKQASVKPVESLDEASTKPEPTEIRNKNIEDRKENKEDIKEKHPTGVKRKRAPFVKPTLDEVRAYCLERGNSVNAEAWMAHYESNGWKVGNSPMKDWKAAVRTWEHNNYDNRTRAKPENGTQFNNNFHQRDYDMNSLEAQLRKAQRGTA